MINLFQRIRRAFEIPFDPADEKTNRDAIIAGLLNLAILVSFSYLVASVILTGFLSHQFFVIFAALVGFVLLRGGVYKGYSKAVSVLLLFSLWGIVSYEFLGFENGLRAPAYTAALAFIIVYAGLLHGNYMAVGILLASLAINIVISVAEMSGNYLTDPKIPQNEWVLIGQVIFLGGISYLMTRTLRNFRKSISLYRTEADNRRKAEEDLATAYETTLEGWARALELRDKETEGHSRRVVDLSVALAEKLDVCTEDACFVRYGALLHDIGKMGIPNEILHKNGPLTAEEREIVNLHPVYANDLLKEIDYLQPAIAIPCYHHENWDGTGYPEGLKGEEIPLPARLFAVVDNWDALLSDRPYRKAWPREKVIAYLREESGKKFDPHVVEIFLQDVISL